MDRQRIQRIEEILDRVIDLDSGERGAVLDEMCAGDDALRAEVDELLSVEADALHYFDDFRHDVGASATGEIDTAIGRDKQVGVWRLGKLIGRGGMSAVYLGQRVGTGFEQTAAVKLLRHDLRDGPAAERFAAEQRILARLEHPAIARLIDGGIADDGTPYLVLEYVDGVPITDYCDREHLDIDARLRLFESVIDAVAYAHRNLVVHRDLKPSNILVDGDGQVKLLDFGIAKLLESDEDADVTRTEHRAMTLMYAAPEQISGEAITTATDVYALGVLLYELLAGCRPYEVQGLTPAAAERAITGAQPELPSAGASDDAASLRDMRPERLRRALRGDLDNVCMMALRKEPQRRYHSAALLGEDLRDYRLGRTVRAQPDTVGYRVRKFVGRHRAGVAVTAVFAVLLIGFAATMTVISAQLARERELSDRVIELFVDVFTTADPSQGETITAREVLDRGASEVRSELAGQPEVQGELLDVLGRVYLNLGLYDQAVGLLGSSAEIVELREAGTPRHAASLVTLGDAYRLRGDYEEAESTLRRAVAINEGLEGTQGPNTARSLTALGRVLVARGAYDEAGIELQRSLTILRAAPEDEPEVLADTLESLGGLALARGEFGDAMSLFQESLDLRRILYGDNHVRVGTSLNNLATAAGQSGEHARAETLQREAIDVYTAVFGPRHPNVATAQNNLALTLFITGQHAASEELFETSMALRRELLGDNHPDLAASASNFGLLLQTVGRLDEAGAMYDEALAIQRSNFGDQHPRTAYSLNNLGMLEQKRGNLERAEALLAEGLAVFSGLFGQQHPVTATTMSNLASVQLDGGNLVDAESNYRESLAIREAVLPADHLDTSYSLVGLARLLARSGDPELREEAVASATRALRIRESSLPPGHALIDEAQQVLNDLETS